LTASHPREHRGRDKSVYGKVVIGKEHSLSKEYRGTDNSGVRTWKRREQEGGTYNLLGIEKDKLGQGKKVDKQGTHHLEI
jgi:hypothetical protein